MSQNCPAGELEHDPLVLADIPVICALPDNPLPERVLSTPRKSVPAAANRSSSATTASASTCTTTTASPWPTSAPAPPPHRLHGPAPTAGLPYGGAQEDGRGPAEESGEVNDGGVALARIQREPPKPSAQARGYSELPHHIRASARQAFLARSARKVYFLYHARLRVRREEESKQPSQARD